MQAAGAPALRDGAAAAAPLPHAALCGASGSAPRSDSGAGVDCAPRAVAASAPAAPAGAAADVLRVSALRALSAAEAAAAGGAVSAAVLPTSPQRLPRAPSPPSGAASDSGRQPSGAAPPAHQAPAPDAPAVPQSRKAVGACQVCQADLANSKAYHQRYKICEEHMKASKVRPGRRAARVREGPAWRCGEG